jgi:hypothetical protein
VTLIEKVRRGIVAWIVDEGEEEILRWIIYDYRSSVLEIHCLMRLAVGEHFY